MDTQTQDIIAPSLTLLGDVERCHSFDIIVLSAGAHASRLPLFCGRIIRLACTSLRVFSKWQLHVLDGHKVGNPFFFLFHFPGQRNTCTYG